MVVPIVVWGWSRGLDERLPCEQFVRRSVFDANACSTAEHYHQVGSGAGPVCHPAGLRALLGTHCPPLSAG
jgi:hypothetical protein